MSESFRTTPPEQQWSGSNGNGYGSAGKGLPRFDGGNDGEQGAEVGKTVLIGLLGGLLSAAGYLIYQRLPDEQKERLHSQVRAQVQQRINELRQNFNI